MTPEQNNNNEIKKIVQNCKFSTRSSDTMFQICFVALNFNVLSGQADSGRAVQRTELERYSLLWGAHLRTNVGIHGF